MSHLLKYVSLCLLIIMVGCGTSQREPIEIQPPTALSVEQWKTLPVEEKYAPETFERLRVGDPALQEHENWEAFMQEVIAPARKQDIPM